MSVDYIVASLPSLKFGEKVPLSWEKFTATAGEVDISDWHDLETQLKNAIAIARGGAKYCREAIGCSLYWKNRILAAFKEPDVAKRDELIDRIFWDAAEELTPPAEPLGKGALATYAIRLKIALKRSQISTDLGNAAFDKLTAASRLTF